MRKTLMAAIAAPAVMLFAGAAAAQDAAPTPQPAPAAPARAGDFTDDELRAFAQAVGQIQIIAADVPDGETPSQDQQMQMAQAVETAGLTPNRFNALAQTLPQDPELQQRMQAVLQEQ